MDYKPLGRTGLAVSPLCLGTMGFGPPVQPKQVHDLLKSALDLGINFLDTANCYDGPNREEIVQGYSETMIGDFFEGSLRDDVVILTKGCVPMRPGPNHKGLSASHLIRELDASLKRLKTDYVDVYMLHWPDPFSDIEEVLFTVDTILRSGRARSFGLSNHQAWEVCEYLWCADRGHFPKCGVSEISLSILDRKHENDLPFYQRHNIGVIPLQPLKGGLLSGIYKRSELSKAHKLEQDRDNIPGWTQSPDNATLDRLEALEVIASELGVTLAELAIAWDAAQPAVSSVIVGARNTRDLQSSLRAVQDIELNADVLSRIDRISPGPDKPVNRLDRPVLGIR